MNRKVAIYIRLSRSDQYSESLSIANQREILMNYINDSSEYSGYEIIEFIDNGYTGTNSDRPAMRQLMDMVALNRIDCIIVKDFSRWARNMLIIGDHIERVFPIFNTRFISINDDFDSFSYKYGIGGLSLTFKYFVNEYYSRDISNKIKSAKREKMKNGMYFVENVIYGYKKSDNKYIIDEKVADNIRMIFNLRANGFSAKAIRRILYDKRILSPKYYKKSLSDIEYKSDDKHCIWTMSIIYDILKNEKYIGTYISCNRDTEVIGERAKIVKDKSKWVKIPNHSPAIISEEIFYKVQITKRVVNNTNKINHTYLLKGKVVCGVCNHRMQLSKTGENYDNSSFVCRFMDNIPDMECSGMKINYSDAIDKCFNEIKKIPNLIKSKSSKLDAVEDNFTKNKNTLIAEEKCALYEKYLKQEINLDEYNKQRSIYDNDLIKLNYTKKNKEQSSVVIFNAYNIDDMLEKIDKATSLTDELVEMLVEKIEVYPYGKIDIVFKIPEFKK